MQRKDQSPKGSLKQPKPKVQTTTLWDFPSQHYGEEAQGDGEYAGVTPSYVIWNLLQRYTKPADRVLDPMCGSGTTLDVCKDLNRHGIGFDIAPTRKDVKAADARKLPLPDSDIDFVFLDPPYSTHIKYSGKDGCIGELDAREGGYYEAMEEVISEMFRVVKDGGYLGLYIQDSYAKGKTFCPLGFELFLRLSRFFEPVDVVAVVRHNKKLKRNHWHTSAIEGNFFLRGFNYLFVFRKNPSADPSGRQHEQAGTLSTYFKAVARKEGGVVTPAAFSEALEKDKEALDRHVERKERKKAWKKTAKRPSGPQTPGRRGPPKKKRTTRRPV